MFKNANPYCRSTTFIGGVEKVEKDDAGTVTQTDLGYTGQRNLDAQQNAYSLGLMDYNARLTTVTWTVHPGGFDRAGSGEPTSVQPVCVRSE